MIYGISYFQWAILFSFLVISLVLIINLFTINKLRQEKKEVSEEQRLLAQLIKEIQGYFSKIDTNIEKVAYNEEKLHQVLDQHQKEEDLLLKEFSLNQELFLDRLDRIVDIQQGLSNRFQSLDQVPQAQNTETFKNITNLLNEHKRDTALVKTQLNALSQMAGSLDDVQDHMAKLAHLVTPDFTQLHASLDQGVNQNLLMINESFAQFNETIKEHNEKFAQYQSIEEHAISGAQALNNHIELAKRNMQAAIEQSLDLTPIYKTVHDLIETTKTIFSDYYIAKGEIEKLLNILQEHEHKDFLDLKDEVGSFLADIKIEMKNSLEILKKEHHMGQTRAAENSVKSLAERTAVKEAYEGNA